MTIRKHLIISSFMLITCIFIMNTYNIGNTVTPIKKVISYMVPSNSNPIIGDLVNVTLVLNNSNDTIIRNVVLEFNSTDTLKITNFFNQQFNNTSYNSTEYLSNPNNTEPIFWVTPTYINITWAKFAPHKIVFIWFIVNCTEDGPAGIGNPEVKYKILGSFRTIVGEGFDFTVNAKPITSYYPLPPRGELIWYWWLAGSVLVVLPLIVIFITRITLWKR